MTHFEQIWNAVQELVGEDENSVFSRNDVREQLRVSQKKWGPSFNLVFQGMRVDHPGGAPAVRADFQKVFQRVSHGNYILTEYGKKLLKSGPPACPVNVEDQELSDEEIDEYLHANRLRIEVVATDTKVARARQRRGQARLRQLTLESYGYRCAVCDVTDQRLLVASHIVGWAEAPEHRGDLSNVICLCRIHDPLFEAGYWSLRENMELLRKPSVNSKMIRDLLEAMAQFRTPSTFPPALRFVKHHRERAGF